MAKKSRRKARKPGAGKGGAAGSEAQTDGDSAKATAKKQREEAERGTLGEWVRSLAVAGVLFVILRTFLLQTFVITSGSMEETLLVGDFLIVNRAATGSRIPWTSVNIPGYSTPRRGDVMVFDPHHEEDLKLVKRLIAMEGDTVQMIDKLLYLNGEPQDEPYVRHSDPAGDETHPWMEWQRDRLTDDVDRSTYHPTRDNWGPLVIPDGHYFMLGDNRDTSLDSRYWGPLAEWRLEGRAMITYFSFDKESMRPFPWLREIRWGRIGDKIR